MRSEHQRPLPESRKGFYCTCGAICPIICVGLILLGLRIMCLDNDWIALRSKAKFFIKLDFFLSQSCHWRTHINRSLWIDLIFVYILFKLYFFTKLYFSFLIVDDLHNDGGHNGPKRFKVSFFLIYNESCFCPGFILYTKRLIAKMQLILLNSV